MSFESPNHVSGPFALYFSSPLYIKPRPKRQNPSPISTPFKMNMEPEKSHPKWNKNTIFPNSSFLKFLRFPSMSLFKYPYFTQFFTHVILEPVYLGSIRAWKILGFGVYLLAESSFQAHFVPGWVQSLAWSLGEMPQGGEPRYSTDTT